MLFKEELETDMIVENGGAVLAETDSEHRCAEDCIAACPKCITRSCTLNQGHYSAHECSEGHSW